MQIEFWNVVIKWKFYSLIEKINTEVNEDVVLITLVTYDCK